jgi:hypothetical protein
MQWTEQTSNYFTITDWGKNKPNLNLTIEPVSLALKRTATSRTASLVGSDGLDKPIERPDAAGVVA